MSDITGEVVAYEDIPTTHVAYNDIVMETGRKRYCPRTKNL